MIINSNLKKVSGIYMILNSVNNKCYIGSSKNLMQRLMKHRSLLRKNKHDNILLQNTYNKYSEKVLIISILEFCSEDNLTSREQHYINILNPELNLTKLVERNILSKESREKQSRTRIEMFKLNLLPKTTRIILQYDLNNNLIKKWGSLVEASRALNIHVSTIIRCANGTYKQGKGFIWKYEDTKDLVKQEELLETPTLERQKEDNQQPSLVSNNFEGSTTNTRIQTDNAEDSNGNTSILPFKWVDYDEYILYTTGKLPIKSDDIV